MLRLFGALNLLNSTVRTAGSFQDKLEYVQTNRLAPFIARYGSAAGIAERAALIRELASQLSGNSKSHPTREESDRKALYVMLKENKLQHSSAVTNESIFAFYGLHEKKKRKQRLADAVWTDLSSLPHVDLSAQVVLRITSISSEHKLEWVRAIKRNRLQKDSLDTVRACILSIQRQYDRKNAKALSKGMKLALK